MNNYMKVIINGLKQWVNNMLTVLDEKLTKRINDVTDDMSVRIDDVATRQDDMVKSVNNTSPDENGNVVIEIPEGFSGDYNDLINKPTIPSLNGLATETYVDTQLTTKIDNIPQVDWEQNDSTASDYIKNRPFYTGDPIETEMLDINAATEEGWYKYSNEYNSMVIWRTDFWVSSPVHLEEGKTYSITINGEKFTTIAQHYPYYPNPVLGDMEAYDISDYANFNYVFALYEDGQEGFIAYKGAADTPPAGECKLYTDISEINRIDPKYLPEGGVGYDEVCQGVGPIFDIQNGYSILN